MVAIKVCFSSRSVYFDGQYLALESRNMMGLISTEAIHSQQAVTLFINKVKGFEVGQRSRLVILATLFLRQVA